MPFVIKVHIENGKKRITPLIDHAKTHILLLIHDISVWNRVTCVCTSNLQTKVCTIKHSG